MKDFQQIKSEVTEDRGLIERLKARDRMAFEEITRQYESRIYNMHCWMTGNPTLAEDLTQETFLAVWKSLNGFEGRSKLFTWIYRIARNVALQHIRRPKLDTIPFEFTEHESAEEETESVAARRMLRNKVREALAELPPEQREPLVLNKMSGLSHSEVARVLDKPLGTIKWHISQGLQALRISLQEKGVTSSEV